MTKNNTAKKAAIDVSYVAQLAKLKIDSKSLESFQKDMENIVEYVDLLGELELNDVAPTAHPVSAKNIWREDRSDESFPRLLI